MLKDGKLNDEDESVDIYVDYDFDPEHIEEGTYKKQIILFINVDFKDE